MLELWELGGRDDCRFSTFSWRTRLALHHKGLSFAVHPVAVSDKAAIGFSGQGKVPILKHDGRVIPDSWAIALYLEKEFPERPTLFGGEIGQTLTHVFNVWADRELIPALIPFLMRDVLDCVGEADGAHLRLQIESAMKKTLEDLSAGREQAVQAFRRKLQPVRKALETRNFLGGAAPTYADYVLFGLLQWARVISPAEVLEDGDAVAAWFERVLDLYDGVGRKERSRLERTKEAA
ncbi:MAG TPA: glutathione S-transferase N-terminal domain-containing protein [Xanthobacteraceae bacterium]|jgi:glutathione S-transferase|nr:glutathione S-transferase N-terminal domain-containing protein [Xanthobacteraceae bacterium]